MLNGGCSETVDQINQWTIITILLRVWEFNCKRIYIYQNKYVM